MHPSLIFKIFCNSRETAHDFPEPVDPVQSNDASTINYIVVCTPIGCYQETDNGISFRQGGVNSLLSIKRASNS